MTLKTLASILTLAVSKSHGVDSLLGHFSFAECFTITVKLASTLCNPSPHQRDVMLYNMQYFIHQQ